MGPSKVKALCVATRCATAEQFIATFHRFCDERSFFVATLNARPIGLETPFSIQLSDRTPILRGTCVVQAAWTTGDNPFKRPGIQLGIQRLTPDSEPIFRQLQHARRSAPANEAITELTESPSESPVVTVPPIPTGPQAPRPPTTPLPAIGRANTSRRMVPEPVPAVVVPPPKSPPEVKLLEVILPPKPQEPQTQVTQVVEQRTPGSELILPANPLMNLTDESLEGFVDCTLYEETATFFRSPDDGREIDALAEPPRPVLPAMPAAALDEAIRASSGLFALQPSGEMVPIVVENPATGQLAPVVVPAVPPAVVEGRAHRITSQPFVPELRPNRLTGPQMPIVELRPHRPTGPMPVAGTIVMGPPPTQTGQMPPLPGSQVGPLPANPMVLTASSQVGPLPTMTASQVGLMPMPPELPMRKFLGDENVQTPVPAGEAFVAHSGYRPPSRLAALTALPRRVMVIGGAALGALLLVVVVVLVTRSSSSDADAKAPPPPTRVSAPVAEPPVKPAPKPEPKPEPKPAIEAGTEITEGADGPTLVGEGACKLDVRTTPAGTMVSFDGRSVGPSPITIAGSCDRHKVELSHPRYKAEQRFVTMTEDKPAVLDVSLVRPTHSLRVLTSPPGAEVYIAGRRAGVSPTVVQVNGFSGIEVRIQRVGFKPVTKRVYSKNPDDTLAVGLDPLPRPR